MNAIYSCKLYRSHPNKSKINAALANPINAELVKQLRSYLDEEYVKPEYLGHPSNNTHSTDSRGTATDKAASTNAPRRSTATPASHTDIHVDDADVSDIVDGLDDGTETQESNSTSIDQSTAVKGDVVASRDTSVCNPLDLTAIADSICESLNSNQLTCGVDRVRSKADSEIWVYYNDRINLNTVMGHVIDTVGVSHNCLDFNRLARTDNAIVFSISSDAPTYIGDANGQTA